MRELKSLQNQCDEIEKITQEIIIESDESGLYALKVLAQGLNIEVIEMSKRVDEVKNKILGE